MFVELTVIDFVNRRVSHFSHTKKDVNCPHKTKEWSIGVVMHNSRVSHWTRFYSLYVQNFRFFFYPGTQFLIPCVIIGFMKNPMNRNNAFELCVDVLGCNPEQVHEYLVGDFKGLVPAAISDADKNHPPAPVTVGQKLVSGLHETPLFFLRKVREAHRPVGHKIPEQFYHKVHKVNKSLYSLVNIESFTTQKAKSYTRVVQVAFRWAWSVLWTTDDIPENIFAAGVVFFTVVNFIIEGS